MNIEDFKNFIKDERYKAMPSPFELVYKNFIDLGFDKCNSDYFLQNASHVVESLRSENWQEYTALEKKFSQRVYESLISEDQLQYLTKKESIKWFTTEFTDHIYSLSLSNTQSRRSRAGNEFEAIIEFILMGAGITFDTQGSIGSGVFETSNLAKLVDCVVPGAAEYKLNKRNTSLISAKTTLRERWQEVGDEMSRTMAREMYLATLDDSLSYNTIELIGKNNIMLVTTYKNKEENYQKSPYVMSFENMLEELKTELLVWNNYTYPKEELERKEEIFKGQIEKYNDMPFVVNYYKEQIKLI